MVVVNCWLMLVSCWTMSQLVVAASARLFNAVVMSTAALAPWKFVCDVFTFYCSRRLWYLAAKKHLNVCQVLSAGVFLRHSLQASL